MKNLIKTALNIFFYIFSYLKAITVYVKASLYDYLQDINKKWKASKERDNDLQKIFHDYNMIINDY